MSEVVATARRIAVRYHRDQFDKIGAPYIDHVERVAARVAEHGEAYVAVALLHDVLEDTDATVVTLIEAGITAEVIEAVALLTKTPGEPNIDYYARLRDNELARVVKLADIADNTDPIRMAALAPDTKHRLTTKYAKAVAALV